MRANSVVKSPRLVSLHVLNQLGMGVTPSLERASLEDHIRYTLRAAILTQSGERKLHPNLGSKLRNSLFRPLTSATKAEIQAEVRAAIHQSEPRVEIHEVNVASDRSDKSRLLIQLKYRILATQKLDQVRIPIFP